MGKIQKKNDNSKDILDAFLAPDSEQGTPWKPKEFRSILEHQLRTPVAAEAERLSELSRVTMDEITDCLSEAPDQTFQDLLSHRTPSLEILRCLKDFGKTAVKDGYDLPREVGRVLYILAILRAKATCDSWITSMTIQEIKTEVLRCLTYPWLPMEIQILIRDSLQHL